MKKTFLLIALMISVTGFSQTGTKPAKSTNAIKQRLDSIITLPYYKQFFSFDERGNQTLFMWVSWISNANQWFETLREEYSYDAANNVIKINYYRFNYNTYILKLARVDEFEWDDKGNKTMETWLYWDEGVIEMGGRSEYEYHADGKEVVTIYYTWIDNDWQTISKDETIYDEYGHEILNICYAWVGNEWKLINKEETTYDEHGNCIYYLMSFWYGDWVGKETSIKKYEYDYDASGNITLRVSYWCNEGETELLLQAKDIYEYDDAGNITMSEKYYKDWITGDLAGDKEENTYDEVGNRIMFISYEWEMDNWVKLGKCEFIYDLDFPAAMLTIPSSNDIDDYNMEYQRLELKKYSWNGFEYKEFKSDIYYWTAQGMQGISNPQPQNNIITLYPNPAHSEIYVQLAIQERANYSIYNNTGQKLISGQVRDGEFINVESLSPGIYFFNILGQTVKVMKK
ncbi:MAG: T9SS type A sorting domain-containing protein [Lentimicrobiaceae bacterium]|nr:T9SS type A sorting domain-containing protein [Lentimicrobiaceae bacterium]